MSKVLVDTSVWIGHFRKRDEKLIAFLDKNQVIVTDEIIGEIVVGSIKNRNQTIHDLESLIVGVEINMTELIDLVGRENLYAKGLSFVDVMLLAKAMIFKAQIYTHDKTLSRYAKKLL